MAVLVRLMRLPNGYHLARLIALDNGKGIAQVRFTTELNFSVVALIYDYNFYHLVAEGGKLEGQKPPLSHVPVPHYRSDGRPSIVVWLSTTPRASIRVDSMYWGLASELEAALPQLDQPSRVSPMPVRHAQAVVPVGNAVSAAAEARARLNRLVNRGGRGFPSLRMVHAI